MNRTIESITGLEDLIAYGKGLFKRRAELKSELVEVNKDIVTMSAKTNQALWKRIRDDEGWQKIR
jgi:hypothetical protein